MQIYGGSALRAIPETWMFKEVRGVICWFALE